MDKLVGYFPRSHHWNVHCHCMDYSQKNSSHYSMVLTKAMFMRSEYLFIYTCLVPSNIHTYIDNFKNCEDIAMNFLVSGMTASSPPIVDAGSPSGFSGLSGHESFHNQRDYCLGNFTYMFGRDTLLNTSYEASGIKSNIIEIGQERWAKIVKNGEFDISFDS